MDIPGHHKLGFALRGHTTGRSLTSATQEKFGGLDFRKALLPTVKSNRGTVQFFPFLF